MADLTKAQTLMQTNEWEMLDDTSGTPYWESNELTLTDDIGAVVHIDFAHLDGNAVTAGSEPEVIVWIKSGSGDDDWHEYFRVEGTGGTAAINGLDAESASGQKNINLTNTSDFEVPGAVYFLDDNDTLANSEIIVCREATNSGAGGECVALDNLSHTFAINDDLLDIVDQWTVRIPKEVQAARVTAHAHDADATFAIRCRASTASDIV